MSFFKSKKYKMGGGSAKTQSTAPAPTEQFHVISASPATNTKSNKGQAPSAPSSANNEAKIRLSNKTSSKWRLKTLGNLFPEEVLAGESTLVCLKNDQGPVQAVYVIEIREKERAPKIYEFQLKIAKNDGIYELLVDWMNLTKVSGICFKPDLSSSNQPLKLDSNETSVELEITS